MSTGRHTGGDGSASDARLIERIAELYTPRPSLSGRATALDLAWRGRRSQRRVLGVQALVPAAAAAAAAALVLWVGSGDRPGRSSPSLASSQSSAAVPGLPEGAALVRTAGGADPGDAGIWEEQVLFAEAGGGPLADGENLPPEYRAIVAVFFEN